MQNEINSGTTNGAASELSAGLGVTAPRRKMPPLCYVNMQTLDTAVGFWNSEIPDLYEAVYPEAYVDELLRERNNAEKREYEVLGRANALEAELKATQARLGASDELRQAVIEAVAEALGDAYDCTRVWSAWSYGTMSQDDFSLVAEDDSRLAEIADAAISALTHNAELRGSGQVHRPESSDRRERG